MTETTLTNIIVIGNMVRVQGKTRPGINPVYFVQEGSGAFLGLGWSRGGGEFDCTIGPFPPGGTTCVGCLIESNGFINYNWSNTLNFVVAASEKE